MNAEPLPVPLKRIALRAFIGSIVVSALLGIWALLSGEFGDLEVKVLLSSLSISAASLSAMGGAALLERSGKRLRSVPAMVLSCAGLVLLLVGIWGTIDSELFWKTTVTIGVFAVSFAHISLLRLARLAQRHRWMHPATEVAILILALFGTGMMWAESGDEGMFRVLGVLSILVAAATLATPVLHRLGREDVVPAAARTRPPAPSEPAATTVTDAGVETGGAVLLLCPSCSKMFRDALGDVVCPHCATKFRIELRS